MRRTHRVLGLITGALLCLTALYVLCALTLTPALPGIFSSVLLGTVAPHVVLLCVTTSLLSAFLHGWRRWLGVALSVLVAVYPAYMVASTLAAASPAGTRINLAAALVPGSMKSAPDESTHYGEGPRETMEIWTPPQESAGAHPVLVDVHGGGWNSDGRMDRTLQALADRGWLIFRPGYELAQPGHPTAQVVPRQIKNAYEWVAAHAADYGGNPEDIALFGDSAGGGLALNLSYQLARDSAAGGATPVPRATVVLYPTVDVAAVAKVSFLHAGNAATDFVGDTPEHAPELYRALNSCTWATPQAPPTLIIRGGRDHFVPPKSIDAFTECAGNKGADIHDVVLAGQDHAFDAAAFRSYTNQFVVGATAAFIDSHRSSGR